jgi:hypothetical protein
MIHFDPSAELAAPAITGPTEAFPEPALAQCWETYPLPSCWPPLPLEIVDFLPPAHPNEADPFFPTDETDPITGWDGRVDGSEAGHNQEVWTELGDSLDITHAEESQELAGESTDESQVLAPEAEEAGYVDIPEATDETSDESLSPEGDWQELHDQEAHDPIGDEQSSDTANPEEFLNDDYLIDETGSPQAEYVHWYALIIHNVIICEPYYTYFTESYHENQSGYDLEFAEPSWEQPIDDNSFHDPSSYSYLDSPEWEAVEFMDETASPIDLSIDEIAPAEDITAEQPDAYAAPFPDSVATGKPIPSHWRKPLFIAEGTNFFFSSNEPVILARSYPEPDPMSPEWGNAAPHYRTLTPSPLASTSGSFSEETLAENSSLALAAETKDVPELLDSGATTPPEPSLPASDKADPILTSPELFPKEVGTANSGTNIREATETLPLMAVPLLEDFIPLSRSQTATSQPDSEPPTMASTPQETTASEPTEQTTSSDRIGTEVGVRDDPSLALLDPTNPLHQPLLLGRI